MHYTVILKFYCLLFYNLTCRWAIETTRRGRTAASNLAKADRTLHDSIPVQVLWVHGQAVSEPVTRAFRVWTYKQKAPLSLPALNYFVYLWAWSRGRLQSLCMRLT